MRQIKNLRMGKVLNMAGLGAMLMKVVKMIQVAKMMTMKMPKCSLSGLGSNVNYTFVIVMLKT